MTVTKSNLAKNLAQRTGLSQTQANKIVNTVFDLIGNALVQGEEVRITGFGTFRTSETKARSGRNPRTGQQIRIPPSKRASFLAGSQLVEAVRRQDVAAGAGGTLEGDSTRGDDPKKR
jgi:DNA-binding protein HU-beta